MCFLPQLSQRPGISEGNLQTLGCVFMPEGAHLCCLAAAATSPSAEHVHVWCGLDAGQVVVYEFKDEIKQGQSPERDDSSLRKVEELPVPYCDDQPCSYICITQHDRSPTSQSGGVSAFSGSHVWVAMRRRSVVSCWAYGNALWSPFDLSIYLPGVDREYHSSNS